MKKLFLVGGGTGGHCIPISVVYSEAPKNYQCYILTDKRGKRYFGNLNTDNIIILKGLASSQSRVANIINAPFLLIQSIWYNILIRPDVTIGFGGFFTIPVLFASLLMRKKIFLHEGNALIGKANRLLFKYVGSIFTTFNETHGVKLIQNKNSFRVGMPIRNNKKYKINKINKQGQCTICVLGGSQGAKNLAEKVAHSIVLSKSVCNAELTIYHQCREEDVNSVKQIYDQNSITCFVKAYFNNITDILEKTSLIISRAGSSTINEIICFGIPSILIPYPYASDNHQYYNALVLKNLKCSEIILDQHLNEHKLSISISKIINDQKRRESIKEILKKEYIQNSVEKIFTLIEQFDEIK